MAIEHFVMSQEKDQASGLLLISPRRTPMARVSGIVNMGKRVCVVSFETLLRESSKAVWLYHELASTGIKPSSRTSASCSPATTRENDPKMEGGTSTSTT